MNINQDSLASYTVSSSLLSSDNPGDFPYAEVLRKGYPLSSADVLNAHPRMAPAHRAKIFLSFDALKGFRECLKEQEARCASGK